MFTVNLPSLKVCMEFDGDRWTVSDAVGNEDIVTLAVGTIPNESYVRFIVYFRSMWTLACIKAVQNDRVLPLPTPAVSSINTSFWGFDKEHAKTVAAMPFGNPLSYDAGEAEYTTDDIINLFYQCIHWCDKSNDVIIGAMNHNYVKVKTLYLKADVTDQCAVFRSDTERWTLTHDKPEGTRVRTQVGISAYIPEEGYDLDAGTIAIGYDMLADEVTGAFTVMLIANLPEATFNKPTPANVFEEAFDLSTNAMRLLYYLNANPKVPEVTAAPDVVVERADPPEVTFTISTGTPISCGGAFTLEGGHGTFSVYDVACWLRKWCKNYETFVSYYNDGVLSKSARDAFEEKFGQRRAGDTPAPADYRLPLQIVDGLNRWSWSDGGWFPMYGSDDTYLGEIVSIFGGLSIHYTSKDVDMTESMWERLLLNTINAFMLPVPGLAALYYKTAENPDEDEDTTATLTLVDPKTMTQAVWAGNVWKVSEISTYITEGTKDQFGMLIRCQGATQVSGRILAKMLQQMWPKYRELCQVRFDRREELSSQMVYGDFETLKVCVPEAVYNFKAGIHTGFISDVDSPIILYDGKTRICHTTRGWAVNNLASDHTKRVGDVGQYTIGFETGNVDWNTEFEKFLCDFIGLVADYSDEVVQAARLLAIDF